jgi:hypothetical protein
MWSVNLNPLAQDSEFEAAARLRAAVDAEQSLAEALTSVAINGTRRQADGLASALLSLYIAFNDRDCRSFFIEHVSSAIFGLKGHLSPSVAKAADQLYALITCRDDSTSTTNDDAAKAMTLWDSCFTLRPAADPLGEPMTAEALGQVAEALKRSDYHAVRSSPL